MKTLVQVENIIYRNEVYFYSYQTSNVDGPYMPFMPDNSNGFYSGSGKTIYENYVPTTPPSIHNKLLDSIYSFSLTGILDTFGDSSNYVFALSSLNNEVIKRVFPRAKKNSIVIDSTSLDINGIWAGIAPDEEAEQFYNKQTAMF